MISFHCDVCREPCGHPHRAAVLIEQASIFLQSGGWHKGWQIVSWDGGAAGAGRYRHVHVEKCLAKWISENKTEVLAA